MLKHGNPSIGKKVAFDGAVTDYLIWLFTDNVNYLQLRMSTYMQVKYKVVRNSTSIVVFTQGIPHHGTLIL